MFFYILLKNVDDQLIFFLHLFIVIVIFLAITLPKIIEIR